MLNARQHKRSEAGLHEPPRSTLSRTSQRATTAKTRKPNMRGDRVPSPTYIEDYRDDTEIVKQKQFRGSLQVEDDQYSSSIFLKDPQSAGRIHLLAASGSYETGKRLHSQINESQARSGSAFGLHQHSAAMQENVGASGGFAVGSSLQSSCVKFGQRSGKAFFGRKSGAAEEDILHGEADSNRGERKKLEDLLDSVWPKDPLAQQQKRLSHGNYLVGANGEHESQTHQESEIKLSLNRIKETELKLGDMISRHIKRRGPEKFANSSFVVTNRANINPNIAARQQAPKQQDKSRATKPHSVAKKAPQREKSNASRKKSAPKAKNIAEELDVQKKLAQILDIDTGHQLGKEKVHSLQCFRPRELFNINTHALFQKDKVKDPLDSDDASNDDEEDITRLLLASKDMERPTGHSGHGTATSAKIDLRAYDPNKPIEHNIKVLRNIISKAKQASNTTRTASLAASRREELKMSKFMKKDSGHLGTSKIAKESEEAIKYLSKRQPLTVQNSKGVNDDLLFSLPGQKKKRPQQKEQSVAQPARLDNKSLSPPRQQLQLAHTGEKAKFYRNVGATQTSRQLRASLLSSDQSAEKDRYGCGLQQQQQPQSQSYYQHQRGRSLKNTSQTNFTSHQRHPTLQQPVTPLKYGSASRPYGKNQPSMNQNSSSVLTWENTSMNNGSRPQMIIADSIEDDQLVHIKSGQTVVNQHKAQPSNINIESYNVTVYNNPQIINNNYSAVPQQCQPKKTRVVKSQKRIGAARPVSSQLRRKTPQATNRGSRASVSTVNQDRQKKRKIDLGQINFHPVIAEGMGATPKKYELSRHQDTGSTASYIQAPSVQQRVGSDTMPSSKLHHEGISDQVNFARFTRDNTRGSLGLDAAGMSRIEESFRSRSYDLEPFGQQIHLQSYNDEQPLMNMNIQQDYNTSYLPSQKKSSAVVKVDQTVSEKIPTLSLMEMMRILDARNEDMGLHRQINTDKCTPDTLQKLLLEFTVGGGSGASQRFKDYCDSKCVNRKLILQGFSLGQAAAQEIASILAVNREIVHVDLGKNNLQDGGVEAFIRVIQANNNIIHLDLTQNNITAKGAKKIFKALARNESLISLKIGNTENVSKNRVGVKAVPKLNKLLQTSQVISFLDLRSTNLTDAGVALLSDGLRGNRSLFNLCLSKNDITSSGIEKFAPVLFYSAITELDLSLNPLGNNGVKCLSENLFEQVPDERHGGTRRGEKCKLTKLNLSETKFQEQGSYALFRNLNEYRKIKVLILDYNQFESKNMSLMCSFIGRTHIHTLSLNYCRLGDVGGQAIGEALMVSSSIRDLRAKTNEFRDKTAKALASAFEENSVVEKVDLSNNLINDAGGELLGLAIAVNQTLTHLNLRKNNLRATSGAMFAQSMKENKTMKCLQLEKNPININFLEQIGKYIERNTIHLLEYNIVELRENREGYLATQDIARQECRDTEVKYKGKIGRLEKRVELLTVEQEHLAIELKKADVELDLDKIHAKQSLEDMELALITINARTKQLGGKIEQQKEDQIKREKQLRKLMDLQHKEIEIVKEQLSDYQKDQEAELATLDQELAKAERHYKKADQARDQVQEELRQYCMAHNIEVPDEE